MPGRLLIKIVTPVLLLAVGVIALLWLQSRSVPPRRATKLPTAPLVETVELEETMPQFEIRVGGNVVPRREVTISAEISGVIVRKDDDLQGGRHVQKDKTLLQIEQTQYQLKVKELGSEIKQISKDLRQVEVEAASNLKLIEVAERKLVLASNEQARVEALLATNAASQSDGDAAEQTKLNVASELSRLQNERDLIPIRRERLRDQSQLTRLRRQQAQLDLDRTTIEAPFGGSITYDAVEQGDFVQPGDLLLKIEDTSSVEIECSLTTDDLYWLWNARDTDTPNVNDNSSDSEKKFFEVPDVEATVTYSVAGQSYRWTGRLQRYEGGGIDRKTRTVPCRVIVSNPKRTNAVDGPPALMRGMYVTVSLAVTPRIRIWKIPNSAMQPNGQVWIIEDGKLRIHAVKPAKVLADGVLLRADSIDLKAGDRVVITQLVTAIEGMRVRQSTEIEGRSP